MVSSVPYKPTREQFACKQEYLFSCNKKWNFDFLKNKDKKNINVDYIGSYSGFKTSLCVKISHMGQGKSRHAHCGGTQIFSLGLTNKLTGVSVLV